MVKPTAQTRSVGRPRGVTDPDLPRRQLLEATAAVLTEKGYRQSSVRSIAERASVNASLINYYFGSKQGLVLELIRQTVGPAMAQLEPLIHDKNVVGREGLRQFLQHYCRTILSAPWLPQLVMQEVFEDKGELREPFIEEFASRISDGLSRLLARDMQMGKLAISIDPELGALGVLSLTLFPFAARHAVEHIFAVDLDQQLVDRLTEQTLALFYGNPGDN